MTELVIITKAQLEILAALRNVSSSAISHGGKYLIAQNKAKTLFLYAENFGLPECYLYDVGLLISAAKSLGDVLVVPDSNGLTLKADKSEIFIAYSDKRLCEITLPAEPAVRNKLLAEFELKKDQYTQIINLSSNLGVENIRFNFSSAGIIVDSTESRKDNRSQKNRFAVTLSEAEYPDMSVSLLVESFKSLGKTDYQVDITEKSFRFSTASKAYYLAKTI